ncbi:MAG: hypothetical protein IJV00_06465 [Clostridia bacterium]|nr:hypothetical protein [Clostridia bacterium]
MKYGLIGEKLPHSYSKLIHESIGSYEYELKELAPDEVAPFMERADFEGINVTIPYKRAVIPFLDQIDEKAKKIGAVNTVVKRDGKLFGFNTDHFGLTCLINSVAGDVGGKTALILGTGGTSLTARAVLEDLGAAGLVVSRTPGPGQIGYEEAVRTDGVKLIVNTTPVGMFPHPDETPTDLSGFGELEAVIDAIYNPLRTKFVCEAIQRGIAARGGLLMLVAQAVKAAELFTGKTYPDGIIEEVYKKTVFEKENIVLSGMPGSGKSTVGRILAERLGKEFLDTDELITKKTGRTPARIITEDGEKFFREIEAKTVAEAANSSGKVIATGGGAILNEESVKALKRNGRIFFLDRALKDLIPTSDRPLSSDENKLKKIYSERIDVYLSTCDHRIECENSPEKTAGRITEILKR